MTARTETQGKLGHEQKIEAAAGVSAGASRQRSLRPGRAGGTDLSPGPSPASRPRAAARTAAARARVGWRAGCRSVLWGREILNSHELT